MSKKALYILFLIFQLFSLRAQEQDSLHAPSVQTFEMLPVLNPWLNTSNPAGLYLNPSILPARINFYYGLENGNYKRVQQGTTMSLFALQSQAYSRIKDINIFGNFSYEKSLEKNLDYSNTNNPYRGTPYDMTDTVGGDSYNREFFYLNGALSKPVGQLTVLGVAYDFGVGVSVQDKDPRPQNKVLDISLRPGIMYAGSDIKLGVNLIYQYYNEEIDIDIIKENTYQTLFKVLGPGVSLYHQAKSFNRLYKRNSGGFDGQVNYIGSGLNALLGSKFLYFYETVKDGGKGGDASWSYLRDLSILKGMDWNTYGNLLFETGSVIHSVKANFNLITSQGIEVLENLEQVGILDQQDWVFYLNDPKYGSKLTDATLSYSYIKMRNEFRRDYALTVGTNYRAFEQRYYIPYQTEKYENVLVNFELSKSLNIKKSLLSVGAGFIYKINVSGDQDFQNINFLYERLLLPDFLYQTSNSNATVVKASFEFPLKKVFDKFYLDTKARFIEGDNGQSRTIASFSTGVIF